MFQAEVNCISYVYHQLGLDQEEIYRELPDLPEMLKLFKEVSDPKDAEVVAVGLDRGLYGVRIIHLAIMGPDKKTIKHRRALHAPIVCESLQEGLSRFLNDSDPRRSLKIVYLSRKK